MRYVSAAILLFLVLFMVFLPGCSSPSTPPTLPAPSPPPIRTVIASTNDEWSLSLGCYAVVTGYAYSIGSATVDNVVVYITLSYPDGTIRDSTSIYLGSIEPQESKSFQVILDRECGEDYTISVVGTP
jgi:hypothetical protein